MDTSFKCSDRQVVDWPNDICTMHSVFMLFFQALQGKILNFEAINDCLNIDGQLLTY